MSAFIRPFAQLDGAQILEGVLESPEARVSVLSLGCILRDWRVRGAGPGGGDLPATLGFDALGPYLGAARSFGIIAGRVANRIGGARFALDGRMVRVTANEGPNTLHGGRRGLGARVWRMEADDRGSALRLSYDSPHGEEGFPGRVLFETTIRLDGPELIYEMTGRPDRRTPINLAQHSYWNLDGGGDVLGHALAVEADMMTPTDAALLPTGALASVAGTACDFRAPRAMTGPDGAPAPLDVNLALRPRRDGAPAATLRGASGLTLRLWTDQPGLQVYNAPGLDIGTPGHDGARYGPYAGVCLEPQHFPDSVNRPEFPSILHDPERIYRQTLVLRIAPEAARG